MAHASPDTDSPRVALVSIGIGRVQRGYERYFLDLFEAMRTIIPVTLFKGAGRCRTGERVPRGLRLAGALLRPFPLGDGLEGESYRTYRHDCAAYALCLLPALVRGGYDIIHVIDHPLARALEKLRRVTPFRARIIFSNGWGAPPALYPNVDLVQHIARPLYDRALADGVTPSRIDFVPCGINCARFRAPASRAALRRKHGVGENTFVLLMISALNRYHKRVDHVIEEVSRIDGNVLLWIDGNPEDPTLRELAESRLGDRCRITHLPSEQIPELYGLSDLMVHAATTEAFGLAIVEAMSGGLFVLAHQADHFRWLVDDDDALIDMTERGALARRLKDLQARRRRSDAPFRPSDSAWRSASAFRRFDWSELAPAYRAMYHRVAGGPPALTGHVDASTATRE